MTPSLTLNDDRGFFLPYKVFSNLRNFVFSHFALGVVDCVPPPPSLLIPMFCYALFLYLRLLIFFLRAVRSMYYCFEVAHTFSGN